jgi:hypothetical protein
MLLNCQIEPLLAENNAESVCCFGPQPSQGFKLKGLMLEVSRLRAEDQGSKDSPRFLPWACVGHGEASAGAGSTGCSGTTGVSCIENQPKNNFLPCYAVE